MTPSNLPSLATASGVPPALATRSAMVLSSRARLRAAAAPTNDKHRIDRAFADRRAFVIDAADPGLRRERNELRVQRRHVAAADAVFLLRQHDDGAPFRRLVGQRGKLRRIGQIALADAGKRQEFRRLPVAQRDGAGLVEQQRVDIARRFHRAARHGEHVEAHQPVHAGDADGRQQRADRGRDQRHEQRHQHQHRELAAGIGRKARESSPPQRRR